MEQAVKSGIADMVLMGIEPTYPSEKYGYIVPEAHPVIDGRLIAWPGGPFPRKSLPWIRPGHFWTRALNGTEACLRLNWDIFWISVNRTQEIVSFETFRNHYGDLKKISFDYEVVEKARSIAMVSYGGNGKTLEHGIRFQKKLPVRP